MLSRSEKLKLFTLAFVVPIIGSILSFSISRGNEFGSPARSSDFCGNPSNPFDGGSDSGGD
ncbi:hypothetical protein PA25_16090 [Pseudoalteromonas sp. A25]|nr:hypothetical protein PA25_16090 [Pseudoalteromonas sp. A25]